MAEDLLFSLVKCPWMKSLKTEDFTRTLARMPMYKFD